MNKKNLKDTIGKIGRIFRKDGIVFRHFVLLLAVIVVFTTTYSLVLPALTIDARTADATPGIELEKDGEGSSGEEEVPDGEAEKADEDNQSSELSEQSRSSQESKKAKSSSKSKKSKKQPVVEDFFEAETVPAVETETEKHIKVEEAVSEKKPEEKMTELADKSADPENADTSEEGSAKEEELTAGVNSDNTDEDAAENHEEEIDPAEEKADSNLKEDKEDTQKEEEIEEDQENEEGEAFEVSASPVKLARMLTDGTGLWVKNSDGDWELITEDTVLSSEETLIVRLAYEIPQGTLSEKNAKVSYKLPKKLPVNKASARMANDPDNHLNQVIEGVRLPGEKLADDEEEYLAGTYKLDKTLTGRYQLKITFNDYSIAENADSDICGWLMFYIKDASLSADKKGKGSITFSEESANGKELKTEYMILSDGEADSDAQNDVAEEFETEPVTDTEINTEAAEMDEAAEAVESVSDSEMESIEEVEDTEADYEAESGSETEIAEETAAESEEESEANTETESETESESETETETETSSEPGDFSWNVDGKEYEYKIEGGAGMSLRDMFTELGVCSDDPETEEDEVRLFLDSMEDAGFSNPDLAWVGKVQYDNTISSIKEFYEFDCEYAAGLTKDDIERLDSREVYAGEWGFVSLAPFTNEESLNVIMDNGEAFVIRMKDAPISKTMLSASGDSYDIIVNYGEDAEIPNDAELKVREILPGDDDYAEYYDSAVKAAKGEADEDSIGKTITNSIADLSRKITRKVNKDTGIEDYKDCADYGDNYARFFDIEIWSGDQKIEPKAEVSVNIQLHDAPADTNANPNVVHFAEEGPEVMDIAKPEDRSKDEDTESKAEDISFLTNGFSVYGIVYTVDFHWEVDGKEYTFSMPGGGYMSLEALLEVLGVSREETEAVSASDSNTESDEAAGIYTVNGIRVSEETKIFAADVENVVFSNPALVWVGKTLNDTTVGELKTANKLDCQYSSELTKEEIKEINGTEVQAGDWALISMLPFTSEESLTVTMKTGEVFTIKVTDAQDPYGLDGQNYEIIVNGNRALNPVSETETIEGITYNFLNNANPSSGSNLSWHFEFDQEAFDGHGGYYISHEGQYLKMVGTDQNDTSRTVCLVNDKADATPINIVYDKAAGKYSFSNTTGSTGGYLCQFNTDYFGVAGSSDNNANAWMELRNPDNHIVPGFVSPWDVLGDNIKIKLFDYTGTVNGSDINSKWASGPGCPSAQNYRDGSGVNKGRTLLFTGSGRDDTNDPYNYYTGQSPAVMQGIVSNHLGDDGYPELTGTVGTKGPSLGYLFGAGGQEGVTAYTGSGGNGLAGLLRKDENGYYYYSSEQNYATLVGNEIKIYSESYDKDNTSENARKIGFFPFDPYRKGQSKAGEEKGPNGSPYNHQFGMTMEATFVLPPDGKLPNGEDMQFNFSGDDDVWVFIDDVLVLDLGGVHQPLSGTINFAGDGYSSVTDAAVQKISGQTTVGNGKTLAELFEAAGEEYDDSPYSTHTIKFYYLERGGCDSNCTLSFNLLMYKTLTVAKELEGLTDEERAKYANNEFTCDIFVNGELYNGSDTIRYDATGNVIEEGFEIVNGKVNLKPGERVRIIGLQPNDTFYAAEENGLSMTEFYPPRAERFYQDQNKASHEEEVELTEEHEDQASDISDWRTQTYPVENLEELMFTNTLREKNLDVEKTWSDGADKHSGDEVKFKVAAKVKIDGQEYDYTDVISAMYSDTIVQNQKISDVLNTTYTLSAANGWKAQLEHLPAVNNTQQEIFYEIIEVQTANGYASTVTGTDSHNIDVVKIFPEDHTFEDEEIKFKLKKGTEYYNEDSKSWGSSASATVYTLNADNNYTQRFHDFPAGDYSYEEVGNNEGNDNQQTDGLVVYDRALKKFDILNGPFNITVEKKWDPEELANEQVDGRKVEITLGRYILMDKKGNLTIRKEGVPAGADFRANYTVINSETDEIFGIYPYVSGGITIDVPEGSYTVTEEIIQDDDTYTHEHGDNSKTVEIGDGGNASAVFTSSYSPIMGQMTIKSTLEANGTGVSFDDVKYEVYDASGTKVKEIPFSQVTGDGATFEIKTGNYVVREVDVPETPNLVAKFKPKKPDNSDREIGVTVKQGGDPAKAEFKATYQPNKATVKVTISNPGWGNPSEKTSTDFNVGDTIRITYKRNNSETINVPTVTGGTLLNTSPVEDQAPNGNNGWNGTYHVDIKITDKNVLAAFQNPGLSWGSSMNISSTTITLVSAAGTNSTTNVMGRMMLRSPFRASSETYKNIDLPASGTGGTVPDAPEGSKYVEDTSFTYETITLNYGNWSKVLSDLPSVDANGNRYYYYIKLVHEENMPSLVEGSIKLDGDGNHLFVGSDNASTPLTVTNAIPKGSLEITKTIQKNGLVDTSATGTFYYAIYKEEYDAAASPAQTPVKTGSIQVTENGTNTVTVPDLYYGTYYVYELTGEGGTPIVSGSEGVRKAIADTVYQVTGSGTTAVVGESTPSVTLTNNKETVNVEVEKDWQDNNNAKGNRPSQLKVTLSNGTEVTLNSGNNWKAAVNDLPKYNSEGQLIVYTWTEETIGNGYTLIGTNIDSVTGEDGAVTETTTLTNGPDEHYNPKTTFTGTKTWNDDGSIRPDEIVVILYKGEGAQKEEVERKTLEKKEDGSNVWAYEFTNIPVFDEQGNVIQYSVEEVLPNGYKCSLNTGTSSAPGYERDEANDQVYVNEPNADVRISTGVNLGFVVMKHGNDFIIWTPRKATEAELTEIKNKIAAQNNAIGDSEFSQILRRPHTNVYGVPNNDIRKGNMTASIYMDGDTVVVHFGNKNWSQLAWGQLAYTYTPGRADLINTQTITDLKFYKKWINAAGGETEWDKDIQVTVKRNGDDSFSLVYNIAKADVVDGKIISPTTNLESDPKIQVSVTENEGIKTYLFTINGLEYANANNEKYTYTVTETNAQLEGYLEPAYSNVSAPTGAKAAYNNGVIINRQPGVELPSTGGPGTWLFTILGSILILGAGVLLWRRRRIV